MFAFALWQASACGSIHLFPTKYPAQPCLYRLPHGQSEGWKRGRTLGKGTHERQSPSQPLDPWHLVVKSVSDEQNI